ncbi:hypothetical protein CHELA40_15153 [Chelatococcus asaccharovorans]|nr:hypothetical protein CHELA17_60467 [Chelatococcus asaccharovorans]CAH1681662.1 hypothetical protein CHELA40_15153 [Chelatococcus asaccharovorans]
MLRTMLRRVRNLPRPWASASSAVKPRSPPRWPSHPVARPRPRRNRLSKSRRRLLRSVRQLRARRPQQKPRSASFIPFIGIRKILWHILQCLDLKDVGYVLFKKPVPVMPGQAFSCAYKPMSMSTSDVATPGSFEKGPYSWPHRNHSTLNS